MGHKNRKSLHQQVHDSLQSKSRFGHSKHDDKIAGVAQQHIYSISTMQAYTKWCNRFVNFCKSSDAVKAALGHTPKQLTEVKQFAQLYIDDLRQCGASPYTQKLVASSLRKLYGEAMPLVTDEKALDRVTRSRGVAVRDKHFSEEKHADMVTACRCIGFRRAELEAAKAEDVVEREGHFFVRITGKGGRYREAPVIGSKEQVETAVAYVRSLTGHNRVSTACDVHSYRAEYATAIYESEKQPIESLKGLKIDYTALTGKWAKDGSRIYKSAIYACRGARKGQVYDRRALIIASQALGHNRESVTGEHYIRS